VTDSSYLVIDQKQEKNYCRNEDKLPNWTKLAFIVQLFLMDMAYCHSQAVVAELFITHCARDDWASPVFKDSDSTGRT